MSALLDPSNVRVWPPAGGGKIEIAHEERETVPAAPEISIESLVSEALRGEGGDDFTEKTAALPEADKLTLQTIWRSPSAHPIALILLLLDKYGQEYVDWDPGVLKLTLDRDGIKTSNEVWNKIMAGRVVLNSPSPWRQWEVFHWVSRALCGQTPNFVYFEEPELSHLVTGYQIMKIVDPKRPTTLEVDKFIAASFRHEGITYIPEPLGFAQRELEERMIECAKCGALHRDDNDVRCISCGATALKKVPYEFEALKGEIKALFAARRKLPLQKAVEDLPDTGAGNAVYRLLLEWEAAAVAKSQMLSQLRMIGGK
jgi:hypothetical protein